MENRGRGSEYDEEVYVLYYVSYIYIFVLFFSLPLSRKMDEFDSFFSRESEGKDRCEIFKFTLIIFDPLPFCLLMLITPPLPPPQFLLHLIVIRNRLARLYIYDTPIYTYI